jgi:hypothetical protein
VLYLILKAAISGVIVAVVSEIAKRWPGFGALVASWRDKPDAANMASHAQATFWYVLPSLPMFLLIPSLMNRGVSFWLALAAGCILTMALYAAMTFAAPRLGLRL